MIAFDVSLNGEHLCRAGVALGAVTIVLYRTCTRDGALTEFYVSGSEAAGDRLTWRAPTALVRGDVVLIEVTESAAVDPPAERASAHPPATTQAEGVHRPPVEFGPSIAFDVGLNGARLCRAGFDGGGTLTASVVWTSGGPHDVFVLSVDGHRTPEPGIAEAPSWVDAHPLAVGDRVTFAIIEADVVDAARAVMRWALDPPT